MSRCSVPSQTTMFQQTPTRFLMTELSRAELTIAPTVSALAFAENGSSPAPGSDERFVAKGTARLGIRRAIATATKRMLGRRWC